MSEKKTTIESSGSSQIPNDDYKILNFLKNDTTVTVACISALVVVLSFLANMAVYVKESIYLSYWNVDTVYAVVSRPNLLYRLCGEIVYAVSVLASISFINKAYEAYIPAKRLSIWLRKLVGAHKKVVRKTKKKSRNAIKKLRKERKKTQGESGAEIQQTIQDLECALKEAEDCIADAKKLAKGVTRDLKKDLKISIRLATFILVIGVILFELLNAGKLEWIWGSIVVSFFLVSVLRGICSWMYRKKVNRAEMVRAAQKAAEEYFEEDSLALKEQKDKMLTEIKNWEKKYPLSQKIENQLSDTFILSFLASAAAYIVLLFIMFAVFGYVEASGKKDFSVMQFDEQTYAVVYNAGDTVVLEKCNIAESEIVIYTNKQRVTSGTGLVYEIFEFEDVSKEPKRDSYIQKIYPRS